MWFECVVQYCIYSLRYSLQKKKSWKIPYFSYLSRSLPYSYSCLRAPGPQAPARAHSPTRNTHIKRRKIRGSFWGYFVPYFEDVPAGTEVFCFLPRIFGLSSMIHETSLVYHILNIKVEQEMIPMHHHHHHRHIITSRYCSCRGQHLPSFSKALRWSLLPEGIDLRPSTCGSKSVYLRYPS